MELVVGYLVAWTVRKVRRVAGRADAEVDRVLDAGMERLHEVVGRKLGTDTALVQLERDAEAGVEDARTRQRVQLAVEAAVQADAGFAEELRAVLAELAASGSGSGVVHQQVIGFGQAQQAVLGSGTQTNTFGTPAGP